MSCEEWLRVLMQVAEDRTEEVDPSDRERFSRHLEQCEVCRDALETQRAVRGVVGGRPDATVPHGFATRVVSRLDVGTSWLEILRWRTWTFRLAPVAIGLLVLGFAGSSGPSSPAPVSSPGLAESWAFGDDGAEAGPVFTLWGREDVEGEVLLDAVLTFEPDDALPEGGTL